MEPQYTSLHEAQQCKMERPNKRANKVLLKMFFDHNENTFPLVIGWKSIGPQELPY